ncbi:MAG: indolepyruvate ferredoxin oxidoreductase subunit alpha [bacterium]
MEKALLSGNEAIARGAYEAGIKVAAAYPGTPSTEILESISQYKEIYAEWSVNEKVSLEVAAGASMAGARALCAMKHVGLNVAADPMFSMSYIGSNGAFIIISADDPGMHSSQNEQDNRHYARAAKIPCLEPSNSQEAKDFVKIAAEISEQYDCPVIIRMTTRICHTKTVVELLPRTEVPLKPYQRDIRKRIIVPAHARIRHQLVEERTLKLQQYSENFKYNYIHQGKGEMGIVASGISYYYTREAFPDADVFKLSMSWPLPVKALAEFSKKYLKIYVVEENDPFIENQLKITGIKAVGKEIVPKVNELNQEIVKNSISSQKTKKLPVADLPPRPPALCPGCPHTGAFYSINKLKLTATGDIGCYTLGAFPPLNSLDTCVCMGASITNAHGIEKSGNPDLKGKVVAVIGDSTFFHSGLTGLANMIYNQSKGTVLILDNRTTAMTGHQGHPGTGKTLRYGDVQEISIENTVKGMGIKDVHLVDPHNIEAMTDALKKSMAYPGVSVIIAKRPCIFLLSSEQKQNIHQVSPEDCIGCKICLGLGCPAISFRDQKAVINELLCTGCGLCASLCPKQAIKPRKQGVENG